MRCCGYGSMGIPMARRPMNGSHQQPRAWKGRLQGHGWLVVATPRLTRFPVLPAAPVCNKPAGCRAGQEHQHYGESTPGAGDSE